MIETLPDFSGVVGGSSTTATPEAYVEKYGSTPILGDNDWWFDHTLSDYVYDKGVGWPPYGIIVAPVGIDTLVWYDAGGTLHVIDVEGQEIVAAVKNPEYFEDPQYMELWKETIKPLVPTIPNITTMLMVVLGIGVVVLVIQRGR